MRLTPLEEYFYWESCGEFPNIILGRLTFQGKFQREALEASFRELHDRHPLLRCVIEERWGRLYWKIQKNFVSSLEWNVELLDNGLPAWEAGDLRHRPGFQVVLMEGGGVTEVFFRLEHVICDAKALENVWVDLLTLYSNRLGVLKPLSRLNPGLLRSRGVRGQSSNWVKQLGRKILGASLARHFNGKEVAALFPESGNAGVPAEVRTYPQILTEKLGAQELSLLKKAALRERVTLNDLLTVDLQVAVRELRQARGLPCLSEPLRIVVPVSLRNSASRELSACNVISLITMDRSEEDLKEPESLLRRTHEEMTWIREQGLQAAFLSMLSMYRLLPGGLKEFCRRQKRRRGTLVLSNLLTIYFHSARALLNEKGWVEVKGAVLTGLTYTGPLLSGVQVSVVAHIYAGVLHLDLNYDWKRVSESEARSLMERWLARLRARLEC
ncbi:MAG: hypothetical protein HC904_03830 [Blastochloris sp.]|nr:hypothetical protein [Blastochloris sp.]